MWNQMAEEMTALSEDKTLDNLVREGLLNWMRQVPHVVQDINLKPSGKMTSYFLTSRNYEKLSD